jgi:Uma2 family endonuclease
LPAKLLILDQDLIREYIQDRRDRGADGVDEVWEGVYIVPPLANVPHQALAAAFTGIFFNAITLEGRGRVLPGANVSDRRTGWKQKFRAPDVVVVLKESQAIDCETHLMGGPDFLTEIQSPGDDTEEKIPFYAQLRVGELLVIQRDTRQLQLYRHDGQGLVLVEPSNFRGGKWLVSAVIPFAFRRRVIRGTPLTEVQRTDDVHGHWIV